MGLFHLPFAYQEAGAVNLTARARGSEGSNPLFISPAVFWRWEEVGSQPDPRKEVVSGGEGQARASLARVP